MRKLFIMIVCFALSSQAVANTPGSADELEKLNFMVGDWRSSSVRGAEVTAGDSSIRRVAGGRWLQWDFSSQRADGLLQVVTMIGFVPEKGKYAFISFNSIGGEPVCHYGVWRDAATLVVEVTSDHERMLVEFFVKGNGDFDQVHSILSPQGSWQPVRKTVYTRKK